MNLVVSYIERLFDTIYFFFNDSFGNIPIQSWGRTKCDKCKKPGKMNNTCFQKNLWAITLPACKFYNKSHTHYKCEACNDEWLVVA